jgi:hypothetical protein
VDLGDDRLGPLPPDEPEDDGEETTDSESPEEGSVDSAERCERDNRSAKGGAISQGEEGTNFVPKTRVGPRVPQKTVAVKNVASPLQMKC